MKVKKISAANVEACSLPKLFDEEKIDFQSIQCVNWAEYPYKPKVNFRIAHTQNSILLHFKVKEESVRAKYGKDNGSSKIAIITTNPHLRTMNMRREGYARALIEANLPVDPDLYGEVTFVDYEKNVFKTLDQIFSKVPDVDGFFFTTHILALEAFRYFYEKGININKGYELACIHGVSAFRVLAPNMNIARMPIEEIGKNAVRILLGDIKYRLENSTEKREVETLVLPCSLP